MPPSLLPTTTASPRLDGVDVLRGLAIFFVLMNHINVRLRIAKVPYAEGIPEPLIHFFVWNGQFAVQIFFAISGFLIASAALRRWNDFTLSSVRAFYLLRLARIAPLLLSLLAVLSALHVARLKDFVIQPKFGSLAAPLFAALTFHINLFEAQHGYLPGNWDILWSLSVEEIFYLFFPVACWILGRKRLLTIFLCVFVVLGPFGRTVLAGSNELWREYSYLGGMDSIALGCLTALFTSRYSVAPGMRRPLLAAGASLMIFILGLFSIFDRWPPFQAGLDMSILALGTCMVIAASSDGEWHAPRYLQPLVSLGRNSYEVYLTLMFVVFAFFHWFLEAGKPMLAVPAFFLAVVLVSAGLGGLISRTFSEPANRWLRDSWRAQLMAG